MPRVPQTITGQAATNFTTVWVCSRCGTTHNGEERPEECTDCGGTRFQRMFETQPPNSVRIET